MGNQHPSPPGKPVWSVADLLVNVTVPPPLFFSILVPQGLFSSCLPSAAWVTQALMSGQQRGHGHLDQEPEPQDVVGYTQRQ